MHRVLVGGREKRYTVIKINEYTFTSHYYFDSYSLSLPLSLAPPLFYYYFLFLHLEIQSEISKYVYGGLCLSIAWYLCKQKRLNAELFKTKNSWGVMHTNFMNWESDATQKEYNQTWDGILLILWCTHTVHIMNCKSKMKWKVVNI